MTRAGVPSTMSNNRSVAGSATGRSMRRIATLAVAAAAALTLAACGSSEDETALPQAEPIAAIAAPDGQEWTQMVVETPQGGFLMGNPDAPIKLLEYASHTCPHCADFSKDASAPLRDRYVASGVVSYEMRNQIHDPIDLTTAILARCSGPQAFHALAEQFWTNLGPIFENLQNNQDALASATQQPEERRYQAIAEATGLLDFFAARGISRDQAMQCLADTDKARRILEQSTQQTDELGVNGTPTFFLNGQNIGTHTWETLEPILQNAGAR